MNRPHLIVSDPMGYPIRVRGSVPPTLPPLETTPRLGGALDPGLREERGVVYTGGAAKYAAMGPARIALRVALAVAGMVLVAAGVVGVVGQLMLGWLGW